MSRSILDAHSAIQTHLSARWTHTPFYSDNQAVPNDLPDEFALLSIENISSANAGICSEKQNRIEFTGLITLSIITPYDNGSGRGLELAEHALRLLTYRNLLGVVTQEAYVRAATDVVYKNKSRWITPVYCTFRYDAFYDAQ